MFPIHTLIESVNTLQSQANQSAMKPLKEMKMKDKLQVRFHDDDDDFDEALRYVKSRTSCRVQSKKGR